MKHTISPMRSHEVTEVTAAIATAREKQEVTAEPTMAVATIQENDTDTIILGDVVSCNMCRAYLDGFLRKPADGFCPVCGVHLHTLKEKQKRKARLMRLYLVPGVA